MGTSTRSWLQKLQIILLTRVRKSFLVKFTCNRAYFCRRKHLNVAMFFLDKIGIGFVKSVGAFAHFLVTSPTVFLPQLQVVCWTLQAGDKCSTWCRERPLFCPGYPQYPWSGQFVLGPLLLGIKNSCWCATSKGVERETGCCFWEVDQGVIVALGGWLKDCWVGSPKCGVGRRGGTACGGGGSNYLSKQYTLFSWHQLRKALVIYKWTFFQ